MYQNMKHYCSYNKYHLASGAELEETLADGSENGVLLEMGNNKKV